MKDRHKKDRISTSKKPSPKILEKLIRQALMEDIGKGDITSEAIIPAEMEFHGKIITKENGIIAGLEVADQCFQQVNPNIEFHTQVVDGTAVQRGEILAHVKGSARDILKAERVALNFLQRMSGIATLTRKFVDAIQGTSAVLLDTRKTVPGLRVLDKWAVRLGGGGNHRFGLYDMILIKENHIRVAGSLEQAVDRVRNHFGNKKFIEIEVTNLSELQEAIRLKVNRIMLDNMDLEDIQQSVHITAGRIPLEVSGNVTLENISAIARSGVQYISSGILTHSVKALDISLLLTGTN
jgi:nicotinate-nucleotide pyrophosphorylase (carboxylating)